MAYGIQPLVDRGITGHGVTVVLPEEAETGPARPQPVSNLLQSVTDIRQDLADFDSRFGLPAAHIQVVTTLAGSSASPWLAGVEEVEDTELVHAVAPDATLVEILVDPADVSTPAKLAATFAAYVRTAVSNGEVMSQSGIGQDFNVGESSWTAAEVATMNSAMEYAVARHVTVVVASGDYGAIGNGSSRPLKEVSLPASDPWALAAGGTTLTANSRHGRLPNRDRLERPVWVAVRVRWRVQPAVRPPHLSERSGRHRRHPGRARRRRGGDWYQRHGTRYSARQAAARNSSEPAGRAPPRPSGPG